VIAAALLALTMATSTEETPAVPEWLVRAIAMVETRSWCDGGIAGSWIYVDRRIGKAQERGIMQMTPDAFDLVVAHYRLRGYVLSDLDKPRTAVRFGCLYLVYLRQHCASWDQAIEAWNCGLHGRKIHPMAAYGYRNKVIAAASAERSGQ
jgi:hypothetical protein